MLRNKKGISVGPSSSETKWKRNRLDLKGAEWCRGRKVSLLEVGNGDQSNNTMNHNNRAECQVLTWYMLGTKYFTCIN